MNSGLHSKLNWTSGIYCSGDTGAVFKHLKRPMTRPKWNCLTFFAVIMGEKNVFLKNPDITN